MTRINVIPPQELSREHLVAEYREIMRLPKNLQKSLSRANFSMSEIPEEYVLGKGHVKFFYNKMAFLQERFENLVAEMIRRGYNPNYTDSAIFIPEDSSFYGQYSPTQEAVTLNKQRILERSKRNES